MHNIINLIIPFKFFNDREILNKYQINTLKNKWIYKVNVSKKKANLILFLCIN